MDHRPLLDYCLSLPGAEAAKTEPGHHDEVLVGGQAFAVFGPEVGTVTLKCGRDADEASWWRDAYPDKVLIAPYVGQYGWNTFTLADIDDAEFRRAVGHLLRRRRAARAGGRAHRADRSAQRGSDELTSRPVSKATRPAATVATHSGSAASGPRSGSSGTRDRGSVDHRCASSAASGRTSGPVRQIARSATAPDGQHPAVHPAGGPVGAAGVGGERGAGASPTEPGVRWFTAARTAAHGSAAVDRRVRAEGQRDAGGGERGERVHRRAPGRPQPPRVQPVRAAPERVEQRLHAGHRAAPATASRCRRPRSSRRARSAASPRPAAGCRRAPPRPAGAPRPPPPPRRRRWRGSRAGCRPGRRRPGGR